jgi:uncharacterized protein (DUF4415 family)
MMIGDSEHPIRADGVPDHENPEWTAGDFARAGSADVVLAHLFGTQAAQEFLAASRRHVGQRGKQKTPVKQRVTMCVDADVLRAFRETGPGWQTRMNAALRQGMPH